MKDKEYIIIIDHYEKCLEKYGDSHLGVDWPKLEDVNTRFRIMIEVIKNKSDNNVSLLDFGCGLAHLYEYLHTLKVNNIDYSGLDISKKYIEIAKKKYPEIPFFCLDILDEANNIPDFDYIIMNGVFTEKRELSFEAMFEYFKELVSKIFSKINYGMAFNVMSKAVDWEREDLFHLPTDLLINFMTKNLSRNFIIRNDYGLYEYTVYLYK